MGEMSFAVFPLVCWCWVFHIVDVVLASIVLFLFDFTDFTSFLVVFNVSFFNMSLFLLLFIFICFAKF